MQYLRTQCPTWEGPQKALGRTFENSDQISLSSSDMLYFNKFVKLDDDNLTFIGKCAIKKFIQYVDRPCGLIPHPCVNEYGYLFGGIIYRYAKLHNADEDVIKDIETFAKCFRKNDSNLIVTKFGEPKFYFNYRDGTYHKMPGFPDLPPLKIINEDPDFE